MAILSSYIIMQYMNSANKIKIMLTGRKRKQRVVERITIYEIFNISEVAIQSLQPDFSNQKSDITAETF